MQLTSRFHDETVSFEKLLRTSAHGVCRSKLAVMHDYRSRFGVQKTVLIAATAGCVALGFATPSLASVDESASNENICLPAGSVSNISTADASDEPSAPVLAEAGNGALRVATFDANLSRSVEGELFEELSAPGTDDAAEVAKAIQQVRPDVLVLTGIDVDAGDETAEAFNTNYLAVGTEGNDGMTYPYSYTAPSNAGVESGADLDRNGTIGGPRDALGYGEFPDQSSMIIYSKYPIEIDKIRDFTSLSWSKMPDNSIPEEVTDLERNMLPLASVSHWDVPIEVEGESIHILASSAADASVGASAKERNKDQVRFWEDYLDQDTEYITDHRGNRGPIEEDARFIIAGSLKADPNGNGPVEPTAISSLLDSEAITDPQPARTLASSSVDQGMLPTESDARYHTAPDPSSNSNSYRADYVLPSSDMSVLNSGILETNAENRDNYRGFFGMRSNNSANHLVWIDAAIEN